MGSAVAECTCNTADFMCETSQSDSTGGNRKGHRYFFHGLNYKSPVLQITFGPEETPENDLTVNSCRYRILRVLWD